MTPDRWEHLRDAIAQAPQATVTIAAAQLDQLLAERGRAIGAIRRMMDTADVDDPDDADLAVEQVVEIAEEALADLCPEDAGDALETAARSVA